MMYFVWIITMEVGMLEEEIIANEDRNYCVYMHTNKINGKRYIGLTKQQPPEKRWGVNGNRYYNCTHFHNAINKYGWDNFNHEIIKKNLTIDEANQLESKLIKEYDTMNSDKGYNLTSGGDAPVFSENAKEKMSNTWKDKFKSLDSVAQYDKKFNLIRIWEHASDAAKEYGIKSSTIYDCCKGKRKTVKNYIWRYANEPITNDYINWINWRPIKLRVVQFSQDGNKIIRVWNGLTEIFKWLDIPLYDIYLCLEKKIDTAGGYVWKYYKDVKDELNSWLLNN